MKLAVGFVVLAFAGIADSYDAPNIIMMLADGAYLSYPPPTHTHHIPSKS